MNLTNAVEADPSSKVLDGLPPGATLLGSEYVIKQLLVSDAFGNTYTGKNDEDRIVTVKEFMPRALCQRIGADVRAHASGDAETFQRIRDLYLDEAHRLAQLSHPGIVSVQDVFEDNGTAYMIFDFVEPNGLHEIAMGQRTVRPKTLERVVMKVLDAVAYMHQNGVLHGAIAPESILLNRLNDPVLVDFDPARWINAGAAQPSGASVAPLNPQWTATSDSTGAVRDRSGELYALGATIYQALTQIAPPTAQDRAAARERGDPDPYVPLSSRVPGHTSGFLECIDTVLSCRPDNPLGSAANWRRALTSSSVVPFPSGTAPGASAVQNAGEPVDSSGSDSHAALANGSEPDVGLMSSDGRTEPTPDRDRPASAAVHAAKPTETLPGESEPVSEVGSTSKARLLLTSALVAVAALGVGAYFALESGDGAKPQTVAAAVTTQPNAAPSAQASGPTADITSSVTEPAVTADVTDGSDTLSEQRAPAQPVAPVIADASADATGAVDAAVAGGDAASPENDGLAMTETTLDAEPAAVAEAGLSMAPPVAANVPVIAMTEFGAGQFLPQAPTPAAFDVDVPGVFERSAYLHVAPLAAPQTDTVRPSRPTAPRDVSADIAVSQTLPQALPSGSVDVDLPAAFKQAEYPQVASLGTPPTNQAQPAAPNDPQRVVAEFGASRTLLQAPTHAPFDVQVPGAFENGAYHPQVAHLAAPGSSALRPTAPDAPSDVSVEIAVTQTLLQALPAVAFDVDLPGAFAHGEYTRIASLAPPQTGAARPTVPNAPKKVATDVAVSQAMPQAPLLDAFDVDLPGAFEHGDYLRIASLATPQISAVQPVVSIYPAKVAVAFDVPGVMGESPRPDPLSVNLPGVDSHREGMRIAALPSRGAAPATPILNTLPPEAPARAPETTRIETIAGVTTAPAVAFPVLANPVDPTLVLMAGGLVGNHVASGQRITSVNGVAVTNIADVPEILLDKTPVAVGDSVPVRLGLEDPASGVTTEKEFGLPTMLETSLETGVRFQTRFENGEAVTIVVSGSGQGPSDLQRGDRLISLMPSKDPIDTPTALADLLRARISSGETQSSFAVSRKGSLWLVVLQHGA